MDFIYTGHIDQLMKFLQSFLFSCHFKWEQIYSQRHVLTRILLSPNDYYTDDPLFSINWTSGVGKMTEIRLTASKKPRSP